MIKDPAAWQAWEDSYIRSQPVDYEKNLRIFEALYEHARRVGALPPKDRLEGIEFKIRFARDLNALRTP